MFLNALQQQKETKRNNPLNYCVFKKNHLVVQLLCAGLLLASWFIFSPCSYCTWNLVVLKESCLPQTSIQFTKSTLPFPTSGFKTHLWELETVLQSPAYLLMGKWRKITCQISLFHHQLFFFVCASSMKKVVNPVKSGVLLFRPC